MTNDLSPQQLAAMAVAKQQEDLTEQIEASSSAIQNLKDAPAFVAPLASDTSLDDELEALAAQAQAERAEVENQTAESSDQQADKSPQERVHDAILNNLNGHADAPTSQEIDGWKAKYGNSSVQVISFSEDDVFVFTHITLSQWKQVQEIARSVQGTAAAENIDAKLQEKVVRSAILWPKLAPDFFHTCHAGLPSTMYEVILLNSYFLSAGQAMTITTQL
jgi:hypothetical protein